MAEGAGTTDTRGHKPRRPKRIALSVALLVLLAMTSGLAAYKPVYNYYRSSISRCMEWGNAWRISNAHLNRLLDTMETGQDGSQPSASTQRILDRIRLQESRDRKQALQTGVLGQGGCTAWQMPSHRHKVADTMSGLTTESERAIGDLHKLDTHLPPRADDLDRLRAILPGLAEFAEDSKALVGQNNADRLTLVEDLRFAENHTDLHNARTLEETLYRDADRLVRAGNSRKGIDCAQQSCLALTFDDGPDTKLTNQVLDDLIDSRAPATFFPIGQKVDPRTAKILERMTQGGYPVGNHTWSHQDLPDIMARHQEELQIAQSGRAIRNAAKRTVTMVRPPHGRVDEASRYYIGNHLGAAIASYNADSYDWAHGASPGSITGKIKAELQPGSIVLMHDIQPRTAQALPGLLEDLRRKGYRPVTIPELTGEYPRAGAVYISRTNILRP